MAAVVKAIIKSLILSTVLKIQRLSADHSRVATRGNWFLVLVLLLLLRGKPRTTAGQMSQQGHFIRRPSVPAASRSQAAMPMVPLSWRRDYSPSPSPARSPSWVGRVSNPTAHSCLQLQPPVISLPAAP